MKTNSELPMLDSVLNYLKFPQTKVFFLFVGDKEYKSVLDELKGQGATIVTTSDFCGDDDKRPDMDQLVESLSDSKQVSANTKETKWVVTGLGESLAIFGRDAAVRTLTELKDIPLSDGSRVVILLRGLVSLVNVLKNNDPRFDERRYCVIGQAECNLKFWVTSFGGLPVLHGFKAMLAELEKGVYESKPGAGHIVVNTAIHFDHAMFEVREIDNAYDWIDFMQANFHLPASCGNDEYWSQLLKELNQNNNSLNEIFDKHFGAELESNFSSNITKVGYQGWIYFIALKYRVDTLSNGYLQKVLYRTDRFEDLVTNILNVIIDIQHTDKLFASLYEQRKKLMRELFSMAKDGESRIRNFVEANRKDVSESIYKLTDYTRVEREEIIAWITQHGFDSLKTIPLDRIYPALDTYLKKYCFRPKELGIDPEFARLLTDYFDAYKRQKMSNHIESDFLEWVETLARSRPFNVLSTRNELIEQSDKKDTRLYWLDALGVEYLGLIESLVRKKGLSIQVHIARAELPTITSMNRDFFDGWDADFRFPKNDELDKIKHNQGANNPINDQSPVYLAQELEVIERVVDEVSTRLAHKECDRVLIVSDHGASRLAVLRRKVEKYDTDTKGEHSGRCCKLFQGYDLPFASEENGYLVLADYGRFKGSRAADIEVHGGASLEEVIVPIMELSLRGDRVITVQLVQDVVKVDYRTGAVIELFFDAPIEGKNVSILLNEKSYEATSTDSQHYTVNLFDMKRAGDYTASVYVNDDLIGIVSIKVQSKVGKVNDQFDKLF